MFGPVMVVWFVTIAVLGRAVDRASSRTCSARSTRCTRVRFFRRNGWHGFVVLGSVFLVVTGGEALYADMGHFGRRPIRLAWFALVLPGAAAQLLRPGRAAAARSRGGRVIRSTCMAPRWALLSAGRAGDGGRRHRVAGADLRRVLADAPGDAARLLPARRASCTRRRTTIGQIYIPEVNWALMVATIGARARLPQSSSTLAAAYGIAVTATMVITTMLAYVVARGVVGLEPRGRPASLAAFFLVDRPRRSSAPTCSRSCRAAGSRCVVGVRVYIAAVDLEARAAQLLAARCCETRRIRSTSS